MGGTEQVVVASTAHETAHFSGPVVVVDGEPLARSSGDAADGTPSALRFVEEVVFLPRDAIALEDGSVVSLLP